MKDVPRTGIVGRAALALVIVLLGLIVAGSDMPLRHRHDRAPTPSEELYEEYDIVAEAPAISGLAARVFSQIVSNPYLGGFVASILKRVNSFQSVRDLGATLHDYSPVFYPLVMPSGEEVKRHHALQTKENEHFEWLASTAVTPEDSSFRYLTARDLYRAYLSKRVTPSQQMETVVGEIRRLNPKIGSPVAELVPEEEWRRQAEASTRRYARGEPLSRLDGVPILVKEQSSVLGLNQSMGTNFYHLYHSGGKATYDAIVVARLRARGAVILGTTVMHEWGVGVTGNNEVRGTPRNPHDFTRHTGGSSSGSAAAVSANFVPLAVGGDGGGSIRIPSALCGVYGLKITAMRIADSDHGIAWTIGVVGPVANNVHDLALGYSLMTMPLEAGGERGGAPLSSLQPPPHAAWETDAPPSLPLKGLRVCTIRKYNAMANDPAVGEGVEWALGEMRRLGATVMDEKTASGLSIPRLATILRAHTLTILSEMATQSDGFFASGAPHMTRESVISLSLARSITSREYLGAQKIRSWAMEHFATKIWSQCDVLVSPSTGTLAPPISSPAALSEGESDAARVIRIMKFSQLANFLGFPSGVMPLGFLPPPARLPTSVQISASHWNEHVILRVMKALEDVVVKEKKSWPRRPQGAGEARV